MVENEHKQNETYKTFLPSDYHPYNRFLPPINKRIIIGIIYKRFCRIEEAGSMGIGTQA
jgi:hypothetical protein